MEERSGIIDHILTTVCVGFCVLGVFAIVDAVNETRREREREPEHIVTSRGRKLLVLIDSLGETTFEPRYTRPVEKVAEIDAAKRPEL